MLLSHEDVVMVFKLQDALLEFANQKFNGTAAPVSEPAHSTLSLAKKHEIVQALLGRLDLIDAFITANPVGFSPSELEIVSSWRHMVAGRFIALRQLKKHMILLACDGSRNVYALTALSEPLEQMIPNALPVIIETVLLPFRDKIIYNGILSAHNVVFGPGARRSFEDQFRAAKANNDIVTSLPKGTPASPSYGEAPKKHTANRPQKPVPKADPLLKRLLDLIDEFCQASLNEEYAVLCRKLAGKLAAKRPSPLLNGKLETWACGIIRTIGWVNFLADSSQSPHMKLPAIDRAFGVAESTGQGKAKAIRQMLKIHQFDHHWILPSKWESNPLIWTLQDARGFMIDIRKEPVELQIAAFKKGLIPYVPAHREAANSPGS